MSGFRAEDQSMRIFPLFLLAAPLLAGCLATTPPTGVHQPMTARPEPRQAIGPSNGAIYQIGSARPIFEDRRARFVGDTLTITINEKNNAQKTSAANAERKNTMALSVPKIVGIPGKGAQGIDVEANSENKFDGKGGASANNGFTGTITVTVIEVYPNGNLVVSGEKMVAINQGDEFIRFSGVVNPLYINNNTVSSTQVADARIEFKQNGYIDSAQVMGWLGRFFLTFLPF